jgi:ADYC domain
LEWLPSAVSDWHRVAMVAIVCAAAVPVGAPFGRPVAADERINPDRIDRVEADGTALLVHLTSGRLLQGRELEGATLAIVLPGKSQPQRIRIESIVPDPNDPDGEILLYRIKVLDVEKGAGEELCEPDSQGARWAFPIRGQWDANGNHISDEGFTLTCSGGAQGKCVRFGYKPWRTLPDGTRLANYHQACIRLIRADYCGNRGTTRDGMLIDIYDRIGIQRPENNDSQNGLRFEAAWNTKGAVCVAHTRVPANMTLSRLARTCRRLRNRLGAATCTQEKAKSLAREVLLYNNSK